MTPNEKALDTVLREFAGEMRRQLVAPSFTLPPDAGQMQAAHDDERECMEELERMAETDR